MSPGPIRFGHQATVSSADGPGSRLDRVTIGEGRRRSETSTCYRCGDKGHIATDKRCRARKSVCSHCGQVGHIAQVWRSKSRSWKTGERRARDRVHQLSEDEGQESEDEYELRWIRAREGHSAVNLCGDTASRGRKAVNLNVTMQGCSMLMELDTGAAVSIISEESFQRIAGKGVTLKPNTHTHTHTHTHMHTPTHTRTLPPRFFTLTLRNSLLLASVVQ